MKQSAANCTQSEPFFLTHNIFAIIQILKSHKLARGWSARRHKNVCRKGRTHFPLSFTRECVCQDHTLQRWSRPWSCSCQWQRSCSRCSLLHCWYSQRRSFPITDFTCLFISFCLVLRTSDVTGWLCNWPWIHHFLFIFWPWSDCH